MRLLNAIAPIGQATQKPDGNQLCVGKDSLAVKIDGERMLERHPVGEPHGREPTPKRPARRCQSGNFRIGGAENDDIARRLFKVDSFSACFQSPTLTL